MVNPQVGFQPRTTPAERRADLDLPPTRSDRRHHRRDFAPLPNSPPPSPTPSNLRNEVYYTRRFRAFWQYSNTATPPPGTGQLRTNAPLTHVYVHSDDADGYNRAVQFDFIPHGSLIRVRGTTGSVFELRSTGPPSTRPPGTTSRSPSCPAPPATKGSASNSPCSPASGRERRHRHEAHDLEDLVQERGVAQDRPHLGQPPATDRTPRSLPPLLRQATGGSVTPNGAASSSSCSTPRSTASACGSPSATQSPSRPARSDSPPSSPRSASGPPSSTPTGPSSCSPRRSAMR